MSEHKDNFTKAMVSFGVSIFFSVVAIIVSVADGDGASLFWWIAMTGWFGFLLLGWAYSLKDAR